MCDKKYMDEQEGLKNINNFLLDKLEQPTIKIINDIILRIFYILWLILNHTLRGMLAFCTAC